MLIPLLIYLINDFSPTWLEKGFWAVPNFRWWKKLKFFGIDLKLVKIKKFEIWNCEYSLPNKRFENYAFSWFVFSKEFASVKGFLFLLQKAPSTRPLSFFSYEVNGSGALLARFGKKISFKSTAEGISLQTLVL